MSGRNGQLEPSEILGVQEIQDNPLTARVTWTHPLLPCSHIRKELPEYKLPSLVKESYPPAFLAGPLVKWLVWLYGLHIVLEVFSVF